MLENGEPARIPPAPPGCFPPSPPRRGSGTMTIIWAVLVAVFVAVAVVFTLPLAFGANPIDILSGKVETVTEEVQTVESVVVTTDQEVVVEVAQSVLPSVVYIEVEFQSNFRGLNSYAVGSGFIYTSDGYIVTNNHLIEGGSNIQVSLADGSSYRAELIGRDSDMDMAVLKIDASGLPLAELGNSSGLVVGELAVAIGSPEGFEQSVTTGIVSALDRDIDIPPSGPYLYGLIQTDAAINPGNSGGPLCNSAGEIVGINTAIVSESGGYDGIGFAIAIDNAKPVIDELIEK